MSKSLLSITDEEFFERFPQGCARQRSPYDYAIAFFECDCRTTGMPDENVRMARSYRNILIENDLWNQEFQNSYDNLKRRCAFTISNIENFEAEELPWVRGWIMGLDFLHNDAMNKLSERINKAKQDMSAGVFKSRGEIECILDISIDDALYFYTGDNRLRTSRDPQSMLSYAKRCRNVLIRFSKWTDAYQNIYEDMKKSGIRCNIISNINEFEAEELPWG